MCQHQKLHIRNLIRADQPGPLRTAEITQIDIDRPKFVMRASAIQLESGQSLPRVRAMAPERPARDANKSRLRQGARSPLAFRLPPEPGVYGLVGRMVGKCQPDQNVNVE